METRKKAFQIKSATANLLEELPAFREEGFSIRLVRIPAPFEGIPEAHELFHDIYVVFDGVADVITSSELGDGVEESKGEWRGGIMSGIHHHNVEKGDIMIIPAGVPHAVNVQNADVFQAVIKIRVKDGENGGSC